MVGASAEEVRSGEEGLSQGERVGAAVVGPAGQATAVEDGVRAGEVGGVGELVLEASGSGVTGSVV